MEKLKVLALIVTGQILFFAGAGFIFGYFVEAVFRRAGEPDQSLIFWYLPVLFIGLAGLGSGIMLTSAGIRRLKKIRSINQ